MGPPGANSEPRLNSNPTNSFCPRGWEWAAAKDAKLVLKHMGASGYLLPQPLFCPDTRVKGMELYLVPSEFPLLAQAWDGIGRGLTA